jgi:hypothetical protein
MILAQFDAAFHYTIPVFLHSKMIAHRRWKINFGNVQFGGGIGLGFGSGFTDISVAPSAIYNFNEYVAFGAGLQYKYLKQRDFCVSFVWRKRNCTFESHK